MRTDMTTQTGTATSFANTDTVKARLVGLGEQAFACWEYLLDGDFDDEANQVILEAAGLALESEPLTPRTIRALQETLIELAEHLSLNLRQFGPFNPALHCTDVGVRRMVVLIATSHAARNNGLGFLNKFRQSYPDALNHGEERLRCHFVTIDKSTGHTVNY